MSGSGFNLRTGGRLQQAFWLALCAFFVLAIAPGHGQVPAPEDTVAWVPAPWDTLAQDTAAAHVDSLPQDTNQSAPIDITSDSLYEANPVMGRLRHTAVLGVPDPKLERRVRRVMRRLDDLPDELSDDLPDELSDDLEEAPVDSATGQLGQSGPNPGLLGPNKSAARQRADSLLLKPLWQAGYADAEVLALRRTGDSLLAEIRPGAHFVYDSVFVRQAPADLQDALRLDRLNRKQVPFSWADWQQRSRTALRDFENNGRPFAKLKVLEVHYAPRQWKGQPEVGVRLVARFVPGPFIIIDSIAPSGAIREKPAFVGAIARIRKGMPYDQSAIEAAPGLLGNSLYYRSDGPPKVLFQRSEATVILPLVREQNNRFDGLLGLLPPREAGGQLEFTGLVDLRLVSPLAFGEVITFKYEKLVGASQRLNLKLELPYLLNTPFSVAGRFELLRQDTSFLLRTLEPSLRYHLNRLITLTAYYRGENANLLDARPFEEVVWPPPAVLDSRTRVVGAGLEINTLDYLPNPTRGLFLSTDIGLGRKVITPTVGLDSLDYDRLDLTQPRTEAHFALQGYLPISQRFVLKLANESFFLELTNYFDADQRYFGGGRSLRGFNENEFLARVFTVNTAELRLLLDRDAYLSAFVDGGYYEYARFEDILAQTPVGIGMGLAFRTVAGIVSLDYAVGQVGDIPFQPTRGRVHLGLVNQF